MDYFTKWPEVYAVPKQSPVTMADKLVEEIRFCVPEEATSGETSRLPSSSAQSICLNSAVKTILLCQRRTVLAEDV
ncbi:hypothetical protein COCON_G00064450 [Conger conger]|uniref:Uncharacterized protein n=1 Tax=Conger conger TaxID=82655 RepID=A0A9Q1I330_CONCO|nr:hypothetical protein COCON_G00064450 [Conger conger]